MGECHAVDVGSPLAGADWARGSALTYGFESMHA